MNERDIEDLLSWHADQLLAGRDGRAVETSAALAGLPPARQSLLIGLMHLADRLNRALVEVSPRPAFVAQVRRQLAAAPRAPAAGFLPSASRERLIWMGLGGAAVLASVGVVGYLASRAGRGRAQSSHAPQPALEEAQPAH